MANDRVALRLFHHVYGVCVVWPTTLALNPAKVDLIVRSLA